MYIRHKLFRGALLGSTLAVAALTGAAGAQANSTYTVLHDFTGPSGDGANSGANVTLDSIGNIYGTTDFGGANNAGTIFKLAPDGTQTLLHSFGGTGDGSSPDGAVTIIPSTGDIYGGTEEGGSSGFGVIYKLAADGTYTVLHSFDGVNEGSWLRGRLLHDKRDNFYGTAVFGGPNSDGTVFKYANDGTLTVLHAFNGTDGEGPEHGVIRDQAGNLYGVTAFGGASGDGTVFKIAADGTFTTLYNFTHGADGGFPQGGLDIDKDGNLYGGTEAAGGYNAGTVFKLAPDGSLTTIYNFTGGADGSNPQGDMLRLGQSLYSTAAQGGDPTCQCGVVYEITSTGKEKVLHTFIGSDGAGYSAGLTKSNRTFYGSTESGGGANGYGVVFSVTKK